MKKNFLFLKEDVVDINDYRNKIKNQKKPPEDTLVKLEREIARCQKEFNQAWKDYWKTRDNMLKNSKRINKGLGFIATTVFLSVLLIFVRATYNLYLSKYARKCIKFSGNKKNIMYIRNENIL